MSKYSNINWKSEVNDNYYVLSVEEQLVKDISISVNHLAVNIKSEIAEIEEIRESIISVELSKIQNYLLSIKENIQIARREIKKEFSKQDDKIEKSITDYK